MTQPKNPFRYFDASLEVIQERARVNNGRRHSRSASSGKPTSWSTWAMATKTRYGPETNA
jgi:hypothetical protein